MTLINFWITKNGFYFSNSHLYLVPYDDNFSKRIIRNYDKIRECIFAHLAKKHEIEYTDFRYMDFLVDNEKYLKIMLFLDINQMNCLASFMDINPSYRRKMYFICFEENEKYLESVIRDCNIITIDKSTIEGFLDKDYIEINGMKVDCPTE